MDALVVDHPGAGTSWAGMGAGLEAAFMGLHTWLAVRSDHRRRKRKEPKVKGRLERSRVELLATRSGMKVA